MKKIIVCLLICCSVGCVETQKQVSGTRNLVREAPPETSALVDGNIIVYGNVISRYQDVIGKYMASSKKTPELQVMIEDLNVSVANFSVVMKQKNTSQQDGWSAQEENVYYQMHVNTWNLMNRIESLL